MCKRPNLPPTGPVACCVLAIAYFTLRGSRAGDAPRSNTRPTGRFLIRPPGPLFLAPGRFGKKAKRRSKGLGEKRPNPVSFWFTAVGGRPFWRHKNFRVASLGSEWQKTAHMKLILCVSSKPFCSTILVGCNACNAISASKHLPNNTCWRLACVTDLVGGSSPDAAGKERRAQKMLVSAGH
jgi:hypothetical protein